MLKMKKRLLIIPLLCCICAGLVTVFAQEESIRIEDTEFQLIADNPTAVTERTLTTTPFSGGAYKQAFAPQNAPYSLKAEFEVAEAGLYSLDAVTYMNGTQAYVSEYNMTLNGTVYTKAQMNDSSIFTSVIPDIQFLLHHFNNWSIVKVYICTIQNNTSIRIVAKEIKYHENCSNL